MPSNFITGNGQQLVINTSSGNRNRAVAKAGGGTTNTNFIATEITRPSTFDGGSNDGISNTLIEGSGPVGNSIGYILGTGVASADAVRKNIELSLTPAMTYDPVHDKYSDRMQVLGASGLRHLVNGTLVNATGASVTTPGSATGDFRRGGVSIDGAIQPFGTTKSFYTRVGITNKELTL